MRRGPQLCGRDGLSSTCRGRARRDTHPHQRLRELVGMSAHRLL